MNAKHLELLDLNKEVNHMTQLTTQNTFSLTPANLQEAMQYAEIMAKSSVVPKSYQGKTGDILVAVQMGAELGLKPIQSLQNIAVINGKPSVYGDTLIALVQNNPLCEYINESFDENTMTAICVVKRKGEPEYTGRFSQKDAENAGLWARSGPWKQYPKRMLQMRARGFALRDKFADVLGGLITREEAQDYPVDVTPQEKPKTQDLSSKLDNVLLEQTQSQETPEEIVEDEVVVEVNTEDTQEVQKADPINMELSQLVVTHNVPSEIVEKWCQKAHVNNVDALPEPARLSCIDHILSKYQQVVTLDEM